MRTVISSSLYLPVGQLAKTRTLPAKAAKNGALRVRRHKKQFPHTPARTDAPVFNAQQLIELSDLDLQTYLSDLLMGYSPELHIHNRDYLFSINESYPLTQRKLFIELVRLFALQRINELFSVALSCEDDFLQAIRILKQRKVYRLQRYLRPHHTPSVLELIKDRFTGRYFDEELICEYLYLTIQKVKNVLRSLVLQQVLEYCPQFGYYLPTKPFSYVAH
jgi:hypothetical protein